MPERLRTLVRCLFERILAVPASSAHVQRVDSLPTSCENVGQTFGVNGVCKVFTVHINSVIIVSCGFCAHLTSLDRTLLSTSVCLSNAWIVTKRKHQAKKVQL